MKNKKGMTLVELIVGFALVGIFMASAVVVLSSSIHVFVRANSLAHAQTVADMLLETITSELSSAADASFQGSGEIMIVTDSTVSFVDKNAYPVIMSAEDGRLVLSYQQVETATGDVEEPVKWRYEEGTYLGTKISSLKFAHLNGNLIEVTMILTVEKSNQDFEFSRIIQCYNLDDNAIK
ncbi:PilW family protein [Murimonas intestini]|uniref:Prepilin-type N-terminal cleavage/methylation domain-containing protein n=1 Tax=Murimonas intestini TaxID=1337051 RepID=A0AB73T1E7_9FIRM|nr:type II secretion system protein [Murimonas intestini]MCR1840463.1 type II secretion system GspH family protein [Murimonas intestini]MCR1867426.1 type II secretion system GspH family protein [Murimonas intestini]MCR1884613.1 type II secretion system GspH family protein [Murimonas intestini]